MQSLDTEKQREAISWAITAIYEGNVSEDDRKTFTEVMKELMKVILYPLTSTQLGVFNNFLDLKKLDVLKAVDTRAKTFKTYLDVFVQKHFEDVTNINQVKQANAKPRILKNLDSIFKNPQRWKLRTREDELIKEFLDITALERKADILRGAFKAELKEAGFSRKLPFFHRIIKNNPRLVAGMSHAFNLLGTFSAGYSILKEISDPNSGFSTRNKRDVLSFMATAIGGVGAFIGTYDFLKVLKEKIFQPRRASGTGYRAPDGELQATFQEELATEFSVDLNNMERASKRLLSMMEVSRRLGSIFFTSLGIVADGLVFGISVYDLYNDFCKAGSRDSWKIADDFAFAASAGVGAGLGKQ